MYKTIICCVIKYCNTNNYKNQKKIFFPGIFRNFPPPEPEKIKISGNNLIRKLIKPQNVTCHN